MARGKKNQNTNGNARSGDDIDAPEGFTINVGRERGEGWIKKEEGNEVMARIVGRYTYNLRGKKRAYYQLKLLKPCQIEVEDPDYAGDGDDDDIPRVTVTAEEGALVNCDETAKLAELEAFTKNGGIYDVWFVFKSKKDIGGGQSMWDMAGPKVRVVAKPSEVPQDDVF